MSGAIRTSGSLRLLFMTESADQGRAEARDEVHEFGLLVLLKATLQVVA